jgi:hypothetical protein
MRHKQTTGHDAQLIADPGLKVKFDAAETPDL